MPVGLTITEGLMTVEVAQKLHSVISEIFLDVHQLAGNGFMVPNVIGEVIFVPKGLTFAGGKPEDIAIMELKAPSFALESDQQKSQFVADVTQAIFVACEGRLSKDRIWVNAVYAVDGIWGIAGKAYSNAELFVELSR